LNYESPALTAELQAHVALGIKIQQSARDQYPENFWGLLYFLELIPQGMDFMASPARLRSLE